MADTYTDHVLLSLNGQLPDDHRKHGMRWNPCLAAARESRPPSVAMLERARILREWGGREVPQDTERIVA